MPEALRHTWWAPVCLHDGVIDEGDAQIALLRLAWFHCCRCPGSVMPLLHSAHRLTFDWTFC